MIFRKPLNYLFFSALFLLIVVLLFIPFMAYHQKKIDAGLGITHQDFVLEALPPVDLSLYIFLITYGSVISFVVLYRKDLYRLGHLMLGYGVLLLFRILSMTIIPLSEPENLVHLRDPFLNDLIYPGNITSDLFFSGHVGMLFLLTFLSDYRLIYTFIGVILSFMLLFQHIHYSIDVLVAIPMAYVVVRLVRYFRLSTEK